MKYFIDVITFPLNKKELQNFLHEVYLGHSFIHSWFIEPYFKTKNDTYLTLNFLVWTLQSTETLILDFFGHEKMKINSQI